MMPEEAIQSLKIGASVETVAGREPVPKSLGNSMSRQSEIGGRFDCGRLRPPGWPELRPLSKGGGARESCPRAVCSFYPDLPLKVHMPIARWLKPGTTGSRREHGLTRGL